MSIQILPPQLANQIAAGEVVERPSSVVKELVENALDAGANQIDIEIERGGHKRILIRDNGKGIAKDELQLALSRHATSKIKSLDDLEAIISLGFRGEALASISSVSRLTMTSKPEYQTEAWAANAEGLDMDVNIKPAAHPKGTTVDVVDLFFNTPARRKFLRAEKTEFNHIDVLIKRIALSRPDVTFVLKHNKKLVKRYRGQSAELQRVEQISNRIAEVINKAFVEQAAVNQLSYDDIKMAVWVKRPMYCVNVNPAQYSFVNGRMMRDKLLQHAIRQAFAEQLGPEQQPEYVVFIELPATDVDVNVHPAKHEVRFHHARLLHDLLVRVIQDALLSAEHTMNDQATLDMDDEIPSQKPDWIVTPADGYARADNATQIEKTELKPRAESPKPSYSALKSRAGGRDQISGAQRASFEHYLSAATTEPTVNTDAINPKASPITPQPSPMTTATETYQKPQAKAGLNLVHIDQDQFVYLMFAGDLWLCQPQAFSGQGSDQLETASFEPTPLLVPVRFKLSEAEITWLDEHLPMFIEVGFDLKLHGVSLIIKQVPNCLRQGNKARAIPELISNVIGQQNLDAQSLKRALVQTDLSESYEQRVNTTLRTMASNEIDAFLNNYAIPLQGKAVFQHLQSRR